MSVNIEKDLDLVDVSIVAMSGTRDGALLINHVNVETKIGFFKSDNTLSYKIDSEFKFSNQQAENEIVLQSVITMAFVVNFFIKNLDLVLNEIDINELGQFAILAAHPYARVQVSSIAKSLRLPPVTLGIFQKGKDKMNSITVGEQVFNF